MARNPSKELAKRQLRSDILYCLTSIHCDSSETHQLMAVLVDLTGGSAIGADQRLVIHCQNVLATYTNALAILNSAAALVEDLDTEDPDDE